MWSPIRKQFKIVLPKNLDLEENLWESVASVFLGWHLKIGFIYLNS